MLTEAQGQKSASKGLVNILFDKWFNHEFEVDMFKAIAGSLQLQRECRDPALQS